MKAPMRVRRARSAAALAAAGTAAAALLAGCAAHFRMPMTASDLAGYDTGPALVAYLGQPDASPAVCDLRAKTPHPAVFNADLRSALIAGFVDGQIEPVLWRRCVDALMKGSSADDVSSLLDAVLQTYVEVLKDADLSVDPALAARLTTLHRLYLDRQPGVDAHPAVLTPLIADLRSSMRSSMNDKKLKPLALSFAEDLLATLEVEQGLWQGKPVDAAELDRLAAAGNEMTLTRFAERLPDAQLRTEARRRLIRIHIALSPFAEVRANAPAVEEAMVKDGHNAIALEAHPLLRAYFDGARTVVRGVLVRQDIWHRQATLLAYSQQRPTLSVLPEISFRNSLFAEVQGVSRAVTLCQRGEELDPSPCLKIADVSLSNAFAYLDKGGAFHFRDSLDLDATLPMAAQDNFLLPVLIGGKAAATLAWGLEYERPDPLLLQGALPGARGPEVQLDVDNRNPNRFVLRASSLAGSYAAVVESADAASYRAGSLGAQGAAGSSGFNGASGSAGGQCGSGTDGDRGGDGGPGGRGGDGGNVSAFLLCGAANCQAGLATLRQMLVSLGGAGGPGGSGGAGGAGGSAGTGRAPTTHTDSNGNTVVDDPGCTGGPAGSNGANGLDGPPGPPGNPGHVNLRIQ